ncbi:MAG TPA: S-methyl-5-thioribose-1-phosphate isomerase [Chloroflexota bacterium]|nr:S-methyl-5-thioribose-1-phosphate isomerase [Chloroflexota bacterium]
MKTIEWRDDGPEVWLIDQTRLPLEEEIVRCRDYRQVAHAIKTMQVRGAPAIGVAAAMGVALAAVESVDEREWFDRHIEKACAELAATRPTAVNLFWAIRRMQDAKAALNDRPALDIRAGLIDEAKRIAAEDETTCRRIGEVGSALFAAGDGVLTHCNAGALATVAHGTALAPLFEAHRLGRSLHVFVDETRPFLQGSRLTAWELTREGIDSTLITDNMAAYVMGQGKVQKVIVGADRIAANGDVANKVGTYGVAILAHAHGIPFYVAAPTSTIDLSIPGGAQIPIEERNADEVTHFRGVQVAPAGMRAAHPAFDVTPARYVTAIITEHGILEPPYERSIKDAMK